MVCVRARRTLAHAEAGRSIPSQRLDGVLAAARQRCDAVLKAGGFD
jgi:hypothetical protein